MGASSQQTRRIFLPNRTENEMGWKLPNVPLFRATVRHIKENPELHSQQDWMRWHKDVDPYTERDKIIACFGSRAVLLYGTILGDGSPTGDGKPDYVPANAFVCGCHTCRDDYYLSFHVEWADWRGLPQGSATRTDIGDLARQLLNVSDDIADELFAADKTTTDLLTLAEEIMGGHVL